jgi:hypothetical protein
MNIPKLTDIMLSLNELQAKHHEVEKQAHALKNGIQKRIAHVYMLGMDRLDLNWLHEQEQLARADRGIILE